MDVKQKQDSLDQRLTFLQQIAAGNIDVESPSTAQHNGTHSGVEGHNGSNNGYLSDDESANIDQTLLNLQARLQHLSAIIEGVAAGQLPMVDAATSAEDRLGTGLKAMLGYLRRTIAQVDAGAEALGAAETQLSDTANQASKAVEDIVATFGQVTSHTFSQIAAITRAKEGLTALTEAMPELNDQAQQALETIQQEMETIANAGEEKAKLSVGLRLTTNKMLDQVDSIVVTSRGLKGMALGLQGTMAPYILRNKAEQAAALKIAYLPIADHLVLPLTYLNQLETPDGLAIQPMRCSAWPKLIDLLEEEEADGALILAPLAIQIHAEDVPIKSVMAVHRNGSGLVLRTDVDGMDDVPGRVIAVPHRYSTHNVLLYRALQQADIPYDAVEVKWAPPPLMPYFLQRGTLDGFVSAEPFPEVALDIGAGKMAFLSKEIMPNHMCCVLVVRQAVLEESPERVMRLIQQFSQTGQMISQNPTKAAQDVSPFFGVAPAVMERVLTSPIDRITYDDLQLYKEEFIDFGEAMIDMGLLTEMPDVDSLVDEQLYLEAMKGA